ncbi:MAG: hypothetical protein QW478_01360 [Candidatus Micrarchaeaceae archaeon]
MTYSIETCNGLKLSDLIPNIQSVITGGLDGITINNVSYTTSDGIYIMTILSNNIGFGILSVVVTNNNNSSDIKATFCATNINLSAGTATINFCGTIFGSASGLQSGQVCLNATINFHINNLTSAQNISPNAASLINVNLGYKVIKPCLTRLGVMKNDKIIGSTILPAVTISPYSLHYALNVAINALRVSIITTSLSDDITINESLLILMSSTLPLPFCINIPTLYGYIDNGEVVIKLKEKVDCDDELKIVYNSDVGFTNFKL